MPPGQVRSRKSKRASQAAAAKARDQDTVILVNAALDQPGGPDIAQLRKLAAVRGLVNSELRARIWPLLLSGCPLAAPGVEAHAAASGRGSSSPAPADAGPGPRQPVDEQACYAEWAAGSHKDTTTVRVDVERSLHSFAAFLRDEQRAERRQELARLLNAVVVRHAGSVHYYQGLHDVAAVLLLVAGEAAAFPMLCRLATGHLRDATRPSLDPVIELLGLMAPIVAAADPQLAAFLGRQGLPPFYALSWYITWFAHDLPDFSEVCRLFDLFLATHPLMPLYVGAAAMASQRSQLLTAEEMPLLHSRLVNLRITRRASADQVAVQAIELFKRLPPPQLLRSRAAVLQTCVAPRVQLRGGTWLYPEPCALSAGLWSQARLQVLVQQMTRLPLPGTPAQRRKLVLASVTGVLGSVYVVAMCMLFARSNPGASPLSMLRM